MAKRLANAFCLFTKCKQVFELHKNSDKSKLNFIGYRHIILRNRANRSEGPASVFVKIRTEIYVPAHQKELRQNFATPLKALKEQEAMRQAFANPMRTRSVQKKPGESVAGNVAASTSPRGSTSSTDSMLSKKSGKSS